MREGDAYSLGWNDGYAEGYACKLADATEPFRLASATLPDAIERAADYVQRKYAVIFAGDRPAAIGLVRAVAAALHEREGGG